MYVASRQEKNINRLFNEKGIESYVPIIKTMRQWSDRKKMVELPLISGYIFVKIDALQHDKVLQTKGVVGFVKNAGKVAIVRELEIERLKQLVLTGYHIETKAIQQSYREGDRIKITSGPLKNIEGFVTENKGGRFIDIILDSIGQVIKVKLPEELLTAL